MSLFGKHRNNNKQLDALITSVKNNASNNYKDAAQEDFKKFTARFEELEKSGELNDSASKFRNINIPQMGKTVSVLTKRPRLLANAAGEATGKSPSV